MAEKQYVFVYGTLKRGQSNHHLLKDQLFIREAITQPLYRLHDKGPYPCLVHAEEGRSILGEIYLVDEAALARLDVLEGVPTLYQRGQIELQDCPERVISYFYQTSVAPFPDCGNQWPSS